MALRTSLAYLVEAAWIAWLAARNCPDSDDAVRQRGAVSPIPVTELERPHSLLYVTAAGRSEC
jgi:hypothetical protein